ncbi:MAG: hypothetical protein ACREBG_10635 [Pyrinomonadaceae bacterium]
MTLVFSATAPTDLNSVAAFLTNGFNSPPDAVFARPDVLRWKYFDPGPQWESSRSYVLRQEQKIKAHCGVWPMNLNFRGESVSCICFLDWLSEKDLPGAGVLLKKKLMRLADTSVVVGGSADTRAVVPRIGFQQAGDVTTFARVVRPWKQFRTRPQETIGRSAARLLRNTAWSRATGGAVDRGWSITRVGSFDELPEVTNGSGYPTPWRGSRYLNYWLSTPAAEIAGFVISLQDHFFGYFLLSKVGGQARIADIRLLSEKPADWANAYRLAASIAAEDPEVCETLTIASTPLARQALLESGFRDRGSVPVFFSDPKKKLPHVPPLFLNMIDGDGAYLYDAAYPYVT